MYFARGSYAAYRGPGVSQINKLVYPIPSVKSDRHSFHSLGTHLTLDLQRNVRFGPDLEWIEPPIRKEHEDLSELEEDIDFWDSHLAPDSSREKLVEMYEAVREYLPRITLGGLHIDYVGVRPKIGPPESGFQDFQLRVDYTGNFIGHGPQDGAAMISLLGIESPGLTSCLAIAEHVHEIIQRSQKNV